MTDAAPDPSTSRRSGERMWLAFALPPGVHVGTESTEGEPSSSALPSSRELEAWLQDAQVFYSAGERRQAAGAAEGTNDD